MASQASGEQEDLPGSVAEDGLPGEGSSGGGGGGAGGVANNPKPEASSPPEGASDDDIDESVFGGSDAGSDDMVFMDDDDMEFDDDDMDGSGPEASSDDDSEAEDIGLGGNANANPECGNSGNDSDNSAHCAVCDATAELSCDRCGEEDYCGEAHRNKHLKVHKKVCFPMGSAPECKPAQDTPGVIQDSQLLALPYSVLVHVCGYLRAKELVRLRQVCRHLRSVACDPLAWSHVGLTCGSANDRRLRFAPALHTLTVSYKWPRVNLLHRTNNIKVFVVDWCETSWEELKVDKVIRVLKHYQGHLQVLKIGILLDMKLLKAIDSLNIRELYIGRRLVKTYPGSSKVVTTLELGNEVSEEVVANFIAACRETLVSFHVESILLDKNPWVFSHKSAVSRALKKCHNLERASIPPWGRLSMLNSLPKLRWLCLFEFGDHPHGQSEQFFLSSPVMRSLECLSLHLGYRGHRGLIKAVALGCHDLKELRLRYSSTDRMNLSVTVDVPRDLHVLLGHLGNLEKLTLRVARIPFTVFDGIAAGALPNLTELNLHFCGGTEKARAALEQLKASRTDLRVTGKKLQPAYREEDNDYWGMSESRCQRPICRQPSDCEEDDPLPEYESEDDSSFDSLRLSGSD